MAEADGCGYRQAAHSYLGKNVVKLMSDSEIDTDRHGGSLDTKAEAAVRFATKVVLERGHVSDADVQVVRTAGYDDAQIIEIVQHAALNTWANDINEVAKIDLDFPEAASLAA